MKPVQTILEPLKSRRRLSPFQAIILGFALVILTGALLLMLPVTLATTQHLNLPTPKSQNGQLALTNRK